MKDLKELCKDKEELEKIEEKRVQPPRRYFTLEDGINKNIIENHSKIETF